MTFFEQLPHNGEWWMDPWWGDPEDNYLFPCAKEDVIAGIKIVQRYFDAAWARELATRPHSNFIFSQLMFERGTRSLGLVANLGRMIALTESCTGFAKKIEDLKGEKCEATFLEFEVADTFRRLDYQVYFPPEDSKKSHDVFASNKAHSFAIECKRLQQQDWEKWEEDLTYQLIRDIPSSHAGRALSIGIQLNPRLTDVRLATDEVFLSNKFLEAIASEILIKTKKAIEQRVIPTQLSIDDLAFISIDWEIDNERSSVTGMERTASALFRRIFQNGVLRAISQLPENVPGIAVIYSDKVPPPVFFRLFFDAACSNQRERFEHLLGVVLCPRQTMFKRSTPVIYINKDTKFIESAAEAISVFKTGFGAVPD